MLDSNGISENVSGGVVVSDAAATTRVTAELQYNTVLISGSATGISAAGNAVVDLNGNEIIGGGTGLSVTAPAVMNSDGGNAIRFTTTPVTGTLTTTGTWFY
jgi:hypothetical protein